MDVASFALTALLLEMTPGPNMVWLVLLVALRGRRAGLAAVAGIALGLLLPGLAAAMGMARLVAASPDLIALLRWAGVAYLLWLAWESWRESVPAAARPIGDHDLIPHFRDGLLLNLFNMKSALFFVIALPDFLDLSRPFLPQALTLTFVYVGIATGVHLALMGLAGRAHDLLAQPARERLLKRIGAGLIALVAVWLAVR